MAYELSISGAALASLLHLASSSPSSASSGLLCGLTSASSSSSSSPALSDFDPSPTPNASPSLFITRLFSFPDPLSFFSPQGHLHAAFLRSHFPPDSHPPLLGWFSFRRASSLRPSMRDLAVSLSLSQTLTPANTPCLFLLLSSSLSPNRAVHTHDYRAFLLTSTTQMPMLQPVSLRVLNVGPASSGGHYGAFSPHFSPLPAVPCALPPVHHPHSMIICDEGGQKKSNADQSLLLMKQKAHQQKILDESTEGFEVDRLEKLVGGSASAYTQEIEDLYASMLRKLQSLTHQLEKTSALVFEQENRNLEQRCRLAGME